MNSTGPPPCGGSMISNGGSSSSFGGVCFGAVSFGAVMGGCTGGQSGEGTKGSSLDYTLHTQAFSGAPAPLGSALSPLVYQQNGKCRAAGPPARRPRPGPKIKAESGCRGRPKARKLPPL